MGKNKDFLEEYPPMVVAALAEIMWRPRGAARYTIGSHGNIIIPQILPKMLEYGWLGGMTSTNIYIWNIYIPVEVSEPSMDQLKFVEKLK